MSERDGTNRDGIGDDSTRGVSRAGTTQPYQRPTLKAVGKVHELLAGSTGSQDDAPDEGLQP